MKYFLLVLVLLVGLICAEEAILVSTEIEGGNWVLLKMNPDGTGEETIFSFEGLPSSESGDIKYIEISPDGQWIAMDSDHDHSHAPSNRNIFLIDSDVTGWMMDRPAQSPGRFTGGVLRHQWCVYFVRVLLENILSMA